MEYVKIIASQAKPINRYKNINYCNAGQIFILTNSV
jgi:hypothetical protein